MSAASRLKQQVNHIQTTTPASIMPEPKRPNITLVSVCEVAIVSIQQAHRPHRKCAFHMLLSGESWLIISFIVQYTDSTPNGIKISMALEELGLPYKVEHLNISTNVQKEPAFLAINPNGRIPALTDTFEDGKQINIFESGSIFQYLVEQYDKDHKISYPAGSREHYEVNNWMFFQVR